MENRFPSFFMHVQKIQRREVAEEKNKVIYLDLDLSHLSNY